MFHKECLQAQLEAKQKESATMLQNPFLQCAACQVTYGIRLGSMPDGYMKWYISHKSLSGYEQFGTIGFDYEFASGMYMKDGQKTKYHGTTRQCYLPNNI
jgi:hypothetical protein